MNKDSLTINPQQSTSAQALLSPETGQANMIFTETIIPLSQSDDNWELKATEDTKQHNNPTIANYSMDGLFVNSDNTPSGAGGVTEMT